MAQRYGFTFPFDGMPLAAHKDALQEAERLGYTDAWSYEIDGVDCFTPLALAAAWTEKLFLGTAIANVYTRAPLTLAMSAMGIAEAAPGRFALGIGAGSSVIVEQWSGVPFELPYRKVRDVNRVLRETFSGEKVSGRYETVRGAGYRLSRRLAGPPPVYIAALRERMLKLAGAEADGVIINWLGAGDVPKVVAAAKEGARAAGKDPDKVDVVCRIFVAMTDQEPVVDFIGRRMIAAYLNVPVYAAFHEWLGRSGALRGMWEAWSAGDRKAATAAIRRETIDELLVWGDAATCRRKVQAYADAGVTLPLLNFVPIAQDAAGRAAASLEMLRALAPAAS
ncbi:MAG TPA: LLM class F420-dependent oxidoreductase [Dehalococcoidia bacterium]|nr:LLM class F420-dependent oxidoreductase [Dehalococcoidia bacterium]